MYIKVKKTSEPAVIVWPSLAVSMTGFAIAWIKWTLMVHWG